MGTETPTTSRRRLLTGLGGGAVGYLAGCLGRDAGGTDADTEPPEPVDLSGGKRDDHGGMIIGEHFGPNGQIFYAEHAPEGRENPAWFHALAATMFPYHFERLDRGWEPIAVYVTDYSAVEYDLVTHRGDQYISSHTAPETFAPAESVSFVADSAVLGGMGEDLLPFSDAGDRDRFVDEHGGRVVAYADVDRDLLDEIRG